MQHQSDVVKEIISFSEGQHGIKEKADGEVCDRCPRLLQNRIDKIDTPHRTFHLFFPSYMG